MIGSGKNTARTGLCRARRLTLVVTLCAVQCIPFPALAGDFPFNLKRTSPVVRLAREIDHLEKEIDKDGSVTAKHPDVWSEERLTQHRFEYEQELAKRLDKFEATLSAQIRRSDQAFLATATAITSIVTQTTTAENGDVTTSPGSRSNTAGTLVGDPNASGQQLIVRTSPNATTPNFGQFQLNGQNTNSVSLEPTVFLDQMSRYLHHLHALRRIGEGEDTVKLPGYALNLVRVPISVNPGQETRIGHGAEVTLSVEPHLGEELLPTTFENFVVNDILNEFAPPLTDFLNSPDLNYSHAKLVEYVIQSLYDHDIHWSDSTWWTDPEQSQRSLDMWGDLTTRLLEDEEFNGEGGLAEARTTYAKLMDLQAKTKEFKEELENASQAESSETSIIIQRIFDFDAIRKSTANLAETKLRSLRIELIETVREYLRAEAVKSNIRLGRAASRNAQLPYPLSMFSPIYGQGIIFNLSWEAYRRVPGTIRLKPSKDEDADRPTPTVVHFQDVRSYLQEEIQHAYQLMRRPEAAHLWRACSADLVTAIRARQYEKIAIVRDTFFRRLDPYGTVPDDKDGNDASTATEPGHVSVPVLGNTFFPRPARFQAPPTPTPSPDAPESEDMPPVDDEEFVPLDLSDAKLARLEYRARDSVTAALAWAVVVHSALLNERMTRDMQVTFDATDNPHDVPAWLDFFHPDPSHDARWLFNEYVKARWPVRVFAIDPVTQEQNVGDRFNQRREFQLALAVAFATGQIGIDQMTRFSRRLELDMDTIALNRTVVGFSQGDDTFGWRFLPRIQTPPTPSNATTVFRDMLIGGRSKDDDLRHYRLEPGPRECIALVLKPAFSASIEI